MPSSERVYVNHLIEELTNTFPRAFIIKLDPTEYQGIPDILILHDNSWAALEVKLDERSPIQPNQTYYVDMFNEMSFASFIYPQNEVEVLNALQSAFGTTRQARLFEPQ